ncbi:GNAT family N-acetyltransferase [Ensifer sp. MJa1]|uniref:GNAT family N-acetyltransferase n=1 Tax=Ensifer sp. MJa1 TaxID=2919888 RepID=UPI00300B7026
MKESLTFEVIEQPEVGCKSLTYPRFWSFWSCGGSGWLGIVARRVDGRPAGLALLGTIHAHNGKTGRRLLSLAVDRSSRNTGIGRTLLRLAETVTRRDGLAEIFALYSGRMTSRKAFERVLVACAWETPRASEYMLRFEMKCVFGALDEWSFLLERLKRDGFRTVPWQDLSAADHQAIAETSTTRRVHSDWQPGAHMDRTSSDFSLAIYHDKDIAGWIVGCRSSEAQVHYPLGYTLPRFQRRGYFIAGLIESCRRQVEKLGGDSVAVHWTLPGSAMHRFMETRLVPHLRGQADTDSSAMNLTGSGNAGVRYLTLKRL